MYITSKEVAKELEVTVRTIERWRESGYLKPDHRTYGNHSRYDKEKICLLKQHRQLEQMMS